MALSSRRCGLPRDDTGEGSLTPEPDRQLSNSRRSPFAEEGRAKAEAYAAPAGGLLYVLDNGATPRIVAFASADLEPNFAGMSAPLECCTCSHLV